MNIEKKYNLNQISNIFLFSATSSYLLAFFRILYGIILFFEAKRWGTNIHPNFIKKELLFKFDYLNFLPLLDENILHLFATIMLICSVFIILGFLYRISSFVFIILYVYFFTLDISFFNNHYYFIILLCILLLGIKANNQFSIDRILFKFSDNHIPIWNYNIIKFQIFCLYFYAGITKLNPDWLQLNTMKASLLYDNEYIDNPLLKSDLAIYIFSYGGLIFDISIGFLLLYKPTRVFAIIIALIFHLVNYATIDIGIFPILMMFSCLIFIEPSAFESWVFKLFKQKLNNTVKGKVQSDYNNVIKYALAMYIAIQLLLPLRHFLIKGNVDWTGEGILYSWRMKSVARYRGDLKIILLDKNSKKELKVDLYLPMHQQKILFYKPVLFLQLRDYLLQKTNRKKENTIMNVIVTASINGSKLSYLIHPNIDLCKVEYSKWSHNKFITSNPKQ